MGAIADATMTKCANPGCSATLQSFSDGRFFSFEVISISVAANDDNRSPFDEKPRTQSLQYWLCGACATRFSLAMEPARGLRLVSVGSGTSDAFTVENDQPGDCQS